ncbi:hypothetical protein BKI52_41835 [marine bacterium AO1-C]|nr:hypothetical protein BKI52_41835 [marine bacterium AO1-C]
MAYKKHQFILSYLLIIASVSSSIAQVKQSTNSNSSPMTNQFKSIDNQTNTLVCKLTGKAFAERKKLLQKHIFSKVKKQEETPQGYIFYFPYNADFLIKLTDYIIIENDCCPFLTFNVTLLGQNDIKMKISGDTQTKKIIKEVFVR